MILSELPWLLLPQDPGEGQRGRLPRAPSRHPSVRVDTRHVPLGLLQGKAWLPRCGWVGVGGWGAGMPSQWPKHCPDGRPLRSLPLVRPPTAPPSPRLQKVVAVPSISKTGLQLDFSGMGSPDLWVALITFLYVDFLDATGTVRALSGSAPKP